MALVVELEGAGDDWNGSCVVMGYHLAHAQALASLTTVGSFSASCSLIGSQLSWSYHRAGNQPSQRLQGHDQRLAHGLYFCLGVCPAASCWEEVLVQEPRPAVDRGKSCCMHGKCHSTC
jgi:hypothetical protein